MQNLQSGLGESALLRGTHLQADQLTINLNMTLNIELGEVQQATDNVAHDYCRVTHHPARRRSGAVAQRAGDWR